MKLSHYGAPVTQTRAVFSNGFSPNRRAKPVRPNLGKLDGSVRDGLSGDNGDPAFPFKTIKRGKQNAWVSLQL